MQYTNIDQRLADNRDMEAAKVFTGSTNVVSYRCAVNSHQRRSGVLKTRVLTAVILATAFMTMAFAGIGAESSNALQVKLFALTSGDENSGSFAVAIQFRPSSDIEFTPNSYRVALQEQFTETFSEYSEFLASEIEENGASEVLTYTAIFGERLSLQVIAESIVAALETLADANVTIEREENSSSGSGSDSVKFTEE